MKIWFISYGNYKFDKSKNLIKKEAENFGLFDTIIIYDESNLTDEFKK